MLWLEQYLWCECGSNLYSWWYFDYIELVEHTLMQNRNLCLTCSESILILRDYMKDLAHCSVSLFCKISHGIYHFNSFPFELVAGVLIDKHLPLDFVNERLIRWKRFCTSISKSILQLIDVKLMLCIFQWRNMLTYAWNICRTFKFD